MLGVVGSLAFGAITLVLWYGGKLVFEKKLTAGVLTSFLMYTLTVRPESGHDDVMDAGQEVSMKSNYLE